MPEAVETIERKMMGSETSFSKLIKMSERSVAEVIIAGVAAYPEARPRVTAKAKFTLFFFKKLKKLQKLERVEMIVEMIVERALVSAFMGFFLFFLFFTAGYF
jgi:hypothetical protein